jgi:hypothetical protein
VILTNMDLDLKVTRFACLKPRKLDPTVSSLACNGKEAFTAHPTWLEVEMDQLLQELGQP